MFESSTIKDVSRISYDETFIRIEGKVESGEKSSHEFAVFLTEEVLYFQQDVVDEC
jgi:hypothetical protein